MRGFSIAVVVLIALSSSEALAHTPFLDPSTFAPAASVSAETGYATTLFDSVVGVSADGLGIISPSGRKLAPSSVDVAANVTRFEAMLPEQGTYRLTTGEHYGAVTPMVLDHGHWRPVRTGETLAQNARTSTLQLVTLAEAYVSRGIHTRGAVDIMNGRLAIHPVTHPDEVSIASGFDVELLFDGAPFAFMPFVIYQRGQSEDDMSRVFVTDEHGQAHLSFDAPGLYLAVVRYRCPAPPTAGAAVESYSTSITFNVSAIDEQHALPE